MTIQLMRYFSCTFLVGSWRQRTDGVKSYQECAARISSKQDGDSTGLDSVETKSMPIKHMEIGIETVLTEQELEVIEAGHREDDYIA